jgi:hypothetical protein
MERQHQHRSILHYLNNLTGTHENHVPSHAFVINDILFLMFFSKNLLAWLDILEEFSPNNNLLKTKTQPL